MHILFIDESGTPPPPGPTKDGAPYFVLGGLAVPEDVWKHLEFDLARIKADFAVTGEIKWRYFAPVRPNAKRHSLSHLNAEQKEEIRTRIFKAIVGYRSVKIISVVCNVAKSYELGYINSADDLYWLAYKQMTERFQYYMQDLERTVGQRLSGIVVCDHRAPKQHQRLRELHHTMMQGSKPNISKYNNLIEGCFIAPSHLSVGIQFADMVAGAIYRSFQPGDRRFSDQIDASYRRSPTGKVEGYGLVKFPKGTW
jgi:hypothetical protein